MPAIAIVVALMVGAASVEQSTVPPTTTNEKVIYQPTGKEIAESLGYHTGPKGWENVDPTDPWIKRRNKYQ
jgi:hypothetical protein